MNYIIHKLLADGTDLLGQGSAEHHHLLLVRRVFKHLLHISTHVWRESRENLNTTQSLVPMYGHNVFLIKAHCTNFTWYTLTVFQRVNSVLIMHKMFT